MMTPQTIPADEWATWPDERLLDLRVCQLGVSIEGSTVEPRLAELDQELQARGLTAFARTTGCRTNGSRPTACRASPSRSTSRTRDSRSSSAPRCSKWKVARPSGACRFSGTRPGTPIDNAYKLRLRRRRQQVFGPSYQRLSRVLHAEAVQQELRAASRQLVRAEPSRRRLRRDVRRVAEPAVGLARALCGLAGVEEARVHGHADGRAGGQADAGAHAPQGRSAPVNPQDAAGALRAKAAALRAACTRTSTIAICGACSPIGPSTRAT